MRKRSWDFSKWQQNASTADMFKCRKFTSKDCVVTKLSCYQTKHQRSVSRSVKLFHWESRDGRWQCIHVTLLAEGRIAFHFSSVTIRSLAFRENTRPLQVAMVVCLNLLRNALTEGFLQRVLAAWVQHLLLYRCSIWAPAQNTQGCGLDLDISVSRRTNVSSRSRLDKNLQRLSLSYLRLMPKMLFCPNFAKLQATLIKWAKSAVAIMAVLTRIGNIGQYITYYQKFQIIIINGRENKVTTAIIITCRPILTSRWRLVTYKCLVSKFECFVSVGEANVSVSGFNVSWPFLRIRPS